MNDRRLTDAELRAALHAYLPSAAPMALAEFAQGPASDARQVRALPRFLRTVGDVDPMARRRNLLLVVALLLVAAAIAIASVGAWRTPAPVLPGAERGLLLSIRDGDLYLAEPDGSDEILAVHLDGVELSDPRWSPDGRLIAVQTEEPAVLLVDARTLDVRRLASGAVGTWSPDGRSVLIATPESKLEIVDIDTGRPVTTALPDELADLTFYRWAGAWAPDGRSLLVEGDAGTLIRVDLQTGDTTRLGQMDAFGWFEAVFSPDGTRVAYTRGAERGGVWPILVVDADGANERVLVASDVVPHDPRWSPDGQWIAYMARTSDPESDDQVIEVIRPDGRDRHELARGHLGLVGWAPDSRSLAYTDDAWVESGPSIELRSVDVQGGVSRVIRPRSASSGFSWALTRPGEDPLALPAGGPTPAPSASPFETPPTAGTVDPSGAWSGLGFAADRGRGCQAMIAGFDGRTIAIDEAPGTPAPGASPEATPPEPEATPGPQPAGCPWIRWAPTGTAYAHLIGSSIHVFDLAGRPVGQPIAVGENSPVSWSPDARWLAARASCPDGSGDCAGAWFMVHPDGTASRALPGEPHWSVDGAWLLALSDDSDHPGLFVSAGDGSDLRDIGAVPAPVGWAPDGSRIAFPRDGNVWVAGADGSGAHDVSHLPLGGITLAAWSPDGRHIAALAGQDLLLFGLDGESPRRVGGPFSNASPWDALRWSPDGRFVAAQGDDGLVLVPVDGSPPAVVGGEAAVWSPDGQYLALANSNGTTPIVGADGSGLGPSVPSGDLAEVVWVP